MDRTVQLINQARNLLTYRPDPQQAMRHMVAQGCTREEAFLCVKAAVILNN